jgi:hypothetical protein
MLIILKWVLKIGYDNMDWIPLNLGTVIKHSVSIKSGKFIGQMADYQLLRKGSAQ